MLRPPLRPPTSSRSSATGSCGDDDGVDGVSSLSEGKDSEAIDDNDIMEHAYSQTKDWEPGEVYELYPVDDDPDTLRMEQVQPEDC